jgi:hypothetical protein
MTFLVGAVVAAVILGTVIRHVAVTAVSRWLWVRNAHRLDTWAESLTR